MSLVFPERSGGSGGCLAVAALQWANSGNNMAGKAFQFFLRPWLPACIDRSCLLSMSGNLHEVGGINLT
jgi:hypothetical protein